MENVTITIHGDINIYCGIGDFSDFAEIAETLADAICGDADEDDKGSGETELPEENPLAALIFPNEVKRVIRYRVCEPLLDKMEDACEFRVDDERFNLAFERKGLVTIDGETYLIAPAFAFFWDEDGVPMSINAEALDALEDYLEENGTEISFGKEKYSAVRLEGEICEGI